MRNKYLLPIIIVSLLVNLLLAWQVWAGSPDSPGAPTATNSYTLQDLYNRLTAGTAGTQSTFTEPATAPGAGTMHTLNEIMAAAPALDNTTGATRTQVATGARYWGLRDGAWGLQTGTGVIASGNATDAQVLAGRTYSNDSGASTGTMPNNGAGSTIVPTTTNQSLAAGYWSSANTVTGDTDLVAGNIAQGVNLFGVDGTLTAGSTYNAGVPRTGQTTSYAAGDDGALQRGVAWPNPRFTNNGNGTVTDNLTGLIWLRNANCFETQNWATALTSANNLASGSCGLTDGSSAGQWRLPNVRELQSLLDYGRSGPALPSGHPFTGVQSHNYWSSSTEAPTATFSWYVYLGDGSVSYDFRSDGDYVWPVRGGQ